MRLCVSDDVGRKMFLKYEFFYDNNFVFGSNRFRPEICCRSVIHFQFFQTVSEFAFLLYNHRVLKLFLFQLFKIYIYIVFLTSFFITGMFFASRNSQNFDFFTVY